MSLNQVTSGNRLHIGIFGKRNSGKSSLINALTGQEVALVSEIAGTTTDPVKKAIEIPGLGPCVFIDTAGFDDEGELGQKRVAKTKKAIEKTDIAIVVFDDGDISIEQQWLSLLDEAGTPTILVVNKADILADPRALSKEIKEKCGKKPIIISAKQGLGIDDIRKEIIKNLPEDAEAEDITGSLVKEGDTVLLVIPQDIQAPKGRLILPQVQTLRELMDKRATAVCTTADKMESALAALAKAPDLIITDSQVFPAVYQMKPEESRLTSFSILFAGYKGDLSTFIKGVSSLESLREESKVLIAEACTHAPLSEDIGRVKLPALLRKKVGSGLQIDITAGSDFPEDLSQYDLIIHCGACMFNKKHVMTRIRQAKAQGIPITNYGVALAQLAGILDRIDY